LLSRNLLSFWGISYLSFFSCQFCYLPENCLCMRFVHCFFCPSYPAFQGMKVEAEGQAKPFRLFLQCFAILRKSVNSVTARAGRLSLRKHSKDLTQLRFQGCGRGCAR